MELLVILLILAYPIYLVFKWGVIFWEYGKEEKLPEANLSGKLHEPPSNLEPYFVDALVSKSITPTSRSISSTILYLIKKKFVSISYKDKLTRSGSRKRIYFLELNEGKAKEMKTLSKLEQRLLAFVFQGVGIRASFSKIKSYHIKEASSTRQFWKYWSEEITYQLVNKHYLDRQSYYLRNILVRDTALAGSVVVGILFVFLNFIYEYEVLRNTLFIHSDRNYIVVSVILAFVILLLFLILIFLRKHFYKRTSVGNVEYSKWIAFKKWMEDFSVTKRYPIDSLVLWEDYLIYGLALGVSEKALSELPIKYDLLYEIFEGLGGDSYEGNIPPSLLGGYSRSDFIYSLIESIAFLPKFFGEKRE